MSAFDKAYKDVGKLKAQPSNDEMLDLYAYAKIAQKEDIESSKPGMFDIKGKAKKSHWQKKLDEGITPDQASKKYVEAVESLKGKYGFSG